MVSCVLLTPKFFWNTNAGGWKTMMQILLTSTTSTETLPIFSSLHDSCLVITRAHTHSWHASVSKNIKINLVRKVQAHQVGKDMKSVSRTTPCLLIELTAIFLTVSLTDTFSASLCTTIEELLEQISSRSAGDKSTRQTSSNLWEVFQRCG